MTQIKNRSRPRLETKTKRKLVLSIVIGAALLIIDIVLMVTDPVLIIAKYCTRVAYGTYVHEALSRESESVFVKTYLFNVTNGQRFQEGLDSKLKVEEVGPFTYQEIRKNDGLELDFEKNVMRYSPNIRARFVPERSYARPEDVNISMPNIAMLSMASKVSSYGLIPRMGYNLLTHRLKSKALVHMSAEDYLWGYEEPLIKLGNTIIPGLVNFDTLGVLDRLYDKKAKYVFEVSAENDDKFSIKTVNGSRGLDKWGYKDPEKRSICNSFTNVYEGICYPPDMTSERPIRIYRVAFCRILEMDYHGSTMTPYEVEGLEWRVSNRNYRRNKETECLCNYGNCKEGTSDLSPCFLGLPVVLSNAHFLHADPQLYERIEGLKPDENRHGSFFVIEPKIGMALDTKFSVQVNILVGDVGFNSETSRFSHLVIPVVYFTISQPPLDANGMHYLDLIYFTGPRILLSLQVLLAVLGLGLLGYAASLLLCNRVSTKNNHVILESEKPTVQAPLMR